MPEPKVARQLPADLIPLVYKELRALAAAYMKSERPGNVLQPTALVHEAYLKLARMDRIDWRGKTHFLAVAATTMRQVLVSEARRHRARKRSGAWDRISLNEAMLAPGGEPVDVIQIDEALTRLAEKEPRQSLVLEYRIFGGLSQQEIARILDVSERTVRNDWKLGRARLFCDLTSH